MNDCDIAMKIESIPINPKSFGLKSRARIMPIIKEMPRLAILSIKLQIRPEMAFCLRVIRFKLVEKKSVKFLKFNKVIKL